MNDPPMQATPDEIVTLVELMRETAEKLVGELPNGVGNQMRAACAELTRLSAALAECAEYADESTQADDRWYRGEAAGKRHVGQIARAAIRKG